MKSSFSETNLYKIAVMQSGYFTAKQADTAGISHKNHSYYVKTGSWIKEWRGIYRLSRFPEPDDGQYALWALWSCDRQGNIQGVYSHETALSMFELSDANPAKLHMTVPPNFRKTAKTPDAIILHKKIIAPDTYEQRMGFNVLKPLPNILMLIEEGRISEEILIQALRDGIQKGYLIKSNLMNLDLTGDIKRELLFLLEQVK